MLKTLTVLSVVKSLPRKLVLTHTCYHTLVKGSLSVICVVSVSLPRVMLPDTSKHTCEEGVAAGVVDVLVVIIIIILFLFIY